MQSLSKPICNKSECVSYRAEKSEVFTEDVQSAERHIDLLKQSCSTTSKKMVGLISGRKRIIKLSTLIPYEPMQFHS